MAIYDILAAHRDQRDGGDICSFNGYLEDYLGIIEEDETNGKGDGSTALSAYAG